MRNYRTLLVMVAAVLALRFLACAQEEANKQLKHVPIKSTSAASGQEMYKTNCAVCHGTDSKGNGPAAEALKAPATDLTVMAQKNGGNYPALRVAAIIRGEESLVAHGTKDMPIWGDLFWNMSGGHDAEVQQRVSNLNKYIESLQKKSKSFGQSTIR